MRKILTYLGIALVVFVGFIMAASMVYLWQKGGGLPLGDRIGVVTVEGFMSDSDYAVEAFRYCREEDEIKAVVLRVVTPGGVISPAQEIYEEVKKTAAQKPVVVSMGAVAASGGYYISAPATEIVANPGTATGSIGVIIQFKEMHQLMDTIGLKTQTIKSGPMKDAGSPFKKMNEEERAVFQSLIDDLFAQFVDAVAEGRNMDRDEVLKLADGRVFSGRQALDNGLVDRLGGFWDAVELAQSLAGMEGKPKLDYRTEKTDGFLRLLLGEEASTWVKSAKSLSAPAPRFVLPNW